MLTFFLPFLVALAWSLIKQNFDQASLAADNAATKATIAKWAEVKEGRTADVAVIKAELTRQGEDIKEMRGDIKQLLQRGK